MVGEHGNSMFCPWSSVNINGKRYDDLDHTDPRFSFDPEEIEQKAKYGGWVTFSGKHCTEYAIGTTAARMAEAVFNDSKLVMPASIELGGAYGEKDIYMGVPCIIGKDGAEEIVELKLTDREKEKFAASVAAIRANMAKADEMFPVKQN